MKKVITGAAFVLAITSVSGAATAAGTGASASAETAQTASTAPAKAAKERKYCVDVEPYTGSRVRTRVCGTKRELEQKGIEIEAK